MASATEPTPEGDAGGRRLRIALAALAIAAVTIIAYIPALNAGYIWDDDDYVTNNELLTSLDGLIRVWIPLETPQYYPVVFSTFWVEYQLWGLAPFGYHLVNVLLHIASGLLLWRIMVRLKIPGGLVAAGLVGAVFALHPVHVESVAWITERKNVLSGVFYLAAALTYLHFDAERELPSTERAERGIAGWYGLALVLFILALLSKSVTCSLPAALILVHLYQRKPITLVRIAYLAPMFILGLIAALNTARIEREHVGAEGVLFDFSFLDRLLIASNALLFYPGKIIWPHPLIFIYPRWTIDPGNILTWWSVLVVAIVGAILIRLYLKGLRGPFLALAFFAGTVFPALGFFNVYPHLFSFVADHFQYHASIGVIALLVGGVFWLLPDRRNVVAGILIALLPVLAVLTFRQTTIYEDERTLWLATVEQNPDSWMSWNNLGHLALERNEPALAEEHLRTSLAINPDDFGTWSNLSESLRRQGRNAEALEALRRALELGRAKVEQGIHETESFMAKEYHQLGLIHAALGNVDEADRAYRKSLELQPDRPPVHFSYGMFLLGQDRPDAAARHLRTYLEWNPRDVVALDAMAEIAEDRGRFAEADAYHRRAMEFAATPEDRLVTATTYIRFLATCPDADVRDVDGAITLAERLNAATRGRYSNILDLLAAVYAQGGRFDDAVNAAQEALTAARAAGLDDLAAEIEGRLAQYRDRKTTLP